MSKVGDRLIHAAKEAAEVVASSAALRAAEDRWLNTVADRRVAGPFIPVSLNEL